MLFICTKIKNVAVALLVLLVVLTTDKNKKSSYVNNLVVLTPLEYEKSYNPPIRKILLLSRPWNTKKVTKPLYANNLVVITPLEHEKILARKKNWRKKNS